MSRKRILIDCDGVLADFTVSCVKLINERLNRSHNIEDVTQWDIFKNFSIKEHEHILDQAINENGFCKNIPVLPGAHEAIEKIEKDFGNVYIVTAPHRAHSWVYERTNWLSHHFGISRYRIVYTHAKHVIQGDALIDDSRKNLAMWAEHHINGLPILWERTYNKVPRDNDSSTLINVNDWSQVFKALEKIK